MKKILSLTLAFILTVAFLPVCPVDSFAAESVAVLMQIENPHMLVNGASAEIDPGRGTCPVISSDRTIVPIRAIIEAFGGNVKWNGEDRKVTLTYYSNKIELVIDSYTA